MLYLLLLIGAVYWGPPAYFLNTVPPGSARWAVIVTLSLVPALLGIFLPGILFYAVTGQKH